MNPGRIAWVSFVFILVFFYSSMGFASFAAKPISGNYRFGSNVSISQGEVISEGLLTAAANIDVLGNVKNGCLAFGANINIPGTIEGDLTIMGANVILSGKFMNKVKGGGANIILSGTFENDLEVGAARIVVMPTAVIKGNLLYTAPALEKQEGAQILGKVTQREMKGEKERAQQRAKKRFTLIKVVFWFLSIPGLIILGVIVHALFPHHTEAVVGRISQSPWKHLGMGLVFLVVVPVAIFICLITVVGIPTGIIAGLLYGIAIYISRIYIGVWIGRKLLGTIKKSLAATYFWPLVMGVIFIALVGLIPFLGWFFRLFLLLITLGAIGMVIYRNLQETMGKNTKTSPVDAV